jgi:glycosyltransferase involved in cell wall biosynthesis
MKITHYSFSRTGGAGRVAEALSLSQRLAGLESSFEYLLESGLRNEPLRQPGLTLAASVDEFLVKNPDVPSLFSMARSAMAPEKLDFENISRRHEIAHLHWIEGYLTYASIEKYLSLGGKAVWTLHDMAPFTGGCHFSLGCQGFAANCENCPQVRPSFRTITPLRLKKKHSILSHNSNGLRLVSPSPWIRDMLRQVDSLRNCEITVIPNPVRIEFFESRSEKGPTAEGGAEFSCILIAEDLENPIKRVADFIALVNSNRGLFTGHIKILLVGKNGQKFAKHQENVSALGVLEAKELIQVLDSTDLLVSFSSAESAGMTMKEAAARGVPSLIFSNPGSDSTISKDVSGFTSDSDSDFLNQFAELVSNRSRIRQVGQEARRLAHLENHPDVVSKSYERVYESLLSNSD